jgi:signal transduction histidine kinase
VDVTTESIAARPVREAIAAGSVPDAIAARSRLERRQMVQGALLWRVLAVGIVAAGYAGSVTGGRLDGVLAVAVVVVAYNVALFVLVWRRGAGDARSPGWWFDAAAMLGANLAVALLLPDATLLREYHDVVWPAWLGAIYVWTVLAGWRVGALLIVGSFPAKVLMTTANGVPLGDLDPVTVSSRVGWAVVGVLLVAFVLWRAERWAELTGELAAEVGELSGLRRGIAQRERLHHLMHTDGLGAFHQIRELAVDGTQDARSRLARIAHLARGTEIDVRRHLALLDGPEGPLEALIRDRVAELAARNGAREPEVQIEVAEDFEVDRPQADALLRALAEAVVNVHKHVGVETETQVILRATDDDAALVVIDGGEGFDPTCTPLRGLAAVRDQLERVGGSAVATRAARGGTRWEFRVPRP